MPFAFAMPPTEWQGGAATTGISRPLVNNYHNIGNAQFWLHYRLFVDSLNLSYILNVDKIGGVSMSNSKLCTAVATLVISWVSIAYGTEVAYNPQYVIAHPTRVIGSTGVLAASTRRTVSSTDAPLAFAVLTTERKAA